MPTIGLGQRACPPSSRRTPTSRRRRCRRHSPPSSSPARRTAPRSGSGCRRGCRRRPSTTRHRCSRRPGVRRRGRVTDRVRRRRTRPRSPTARSGWRCSSRRARTSPPPCTRSATRTRRTPGGRRRRGPVSGLALDGPDRAVPLHRQVLVPRAGRRVAHRRARGGATGTTPRSVRSSTSVDGFGLATSDQAVPFQDSTRVWLTDPLK